VDLRIMVLANAGRIYWFVGHKPRRPAIQAGNQQHRILVAARRT